MAGLKHILWMFVLLAMPATASAQFGVPGWNRCNTCRVPAPPVVRVAPPVVQTQICPQVQTTYRQEQFTTYQPVTRTYTRRVATSVDVPVTTHKQVTVDEGSYKMVWVPKMTTKTVAETHIQKQVRYQDVPYQVVENVPQVHTRIVPQQTVHYQARTVAVAPTCCGSSMSAFAPVPSATAMTIPPAYSQTAQAPAITPTPDNPPQQAAVEPKWTKVPQKNASQESAKEPAKIELQSFQELKPVLSAKGMFSRPDSNASALRVARVQ